MRFILAWLIGVLSVSADWKDDQRFYWANNVNPMVALTTTAIHGVDHATGSITRLQVGDQTGILTNLCTGNVTAGTCPLMADCEWDRDHKHVDNDTLLFIACRPVVLGVTYIATNLAVSQAVVYFSTVSKTWIPTTITFTFPFAENLINFGDGHTAWAGTVIMAATPSGGDSGSPVFTSTGEFVGSIVGLASPTGGVINFAYPNGSTYRPAGVTPTFTGGTIWDDGD